MPQSRTEPDFILVRGGTVFAPEPLGTCDVLICHGKMLAIRPNIDPPAGFAVQSIDARGKLVLPGLVDGHVHVAGGGGEGGFRNRTPPASAEALVRAGITTAIGLLGTDAVTRSVSSLLADARRLQALGLSASIYTGAYQLPTRTITDSVRQDVVLIPEVVGAGEIAIADDRGSHPSERDLVALASEVHVGALLAGKKGIVQLHVGDDPDGLTALFRTLEQVRLPVDLFLPTHLNRRAPLLEQAERFARLGGSVDLTSGIYPEAADPEPVNPAAAMSGLLADGVDPALICMSSDSFGSSPVFDAHGHLVGVGIGRPQTLWHFTREAVRHYGVPLQQALATVTRNPARVAGIAKGSIVRGADADLIIADHDLEICLVMARGRVLMDGGAVQPLDPFSTSEVSQRMVSPHAVGASQMASAAPFDQDGSIGQPPHP